MKQKALLELELTPLLLPFKETFWVGVLGSLEVIERVALWDPVKWGENTI